MDIKSHNRILKRIILCLIFLSLVFVFVGSSFATDNTGTGISYTQTKNTNNGLNENNKLPDPINNRTGTHYTTIQSAINEAQNGDTINVEAGTYNENLIIDRNINLIGAGKDSTIIDGQKKDSVITINSNIIVNISGFTIRNGNSVWNAGGITNKGTLTIQDSQITDNRADSGGGIQNNGILTIQNSQITGNHADHYGGGIFNTGTITIKDSQITNNGNNLGGGINNLQGKITLINSIITNNVATIGGGIANNAHGTIFLINSTIKSNIAGYGGLGIYNYRSTVYADSLSYVNEVVGDPIKPLKSIGEELILPTAVDPNSNTQSLNAASSTIGMQKTGVPLPLLVLALFMVLGGLFGVKRK